MSESVTSDLEGSGQPLENGSKMPPKSVHLLRDMRCESPKTDGSA